MIDELDERAAAPLWPRDQVHLVPGILGCRLGWESSDLPFWLGSSAVLGLGRRSASAAGSACFLGLLGWSSPSVSSPSSPSGLRRLGLALRDALGVDRLGLLGLGDHELVLDPPAPLGDPGALADPAAQVVELRPADVAPGHDLEPLDLRRVHRERPLDPDPERLLADRERLPRAAALAGDHDALEDLGPPAGALDHLEVDAHPVARREPRTRFS